MTFRRSLIFFVGLTAVIVPARATYLFNTDLTSFDSNLGGLSPTAVNLLTLTTTSGGLVDQTTGVTFQDQEGGSSGLTVLCISSCSDEALEVTSWSMINIIVPPAYTAISFEVLNSGSIGGSFTVSATNFTSYPGTTSSSPIFVGAVTPSGISNLSLIGPTGAFEIADLNVYSQAPEASTLVLFGSGLLLLGSLRLRSARFGSVRRRNSAAQAIRAAADSSVNNSNGALFRATNCAGNRLGS